MKKLILGLFTMGLTFPMMAQIVQTEELEEVTVSPVNYKYLSDANSMEVVSMPVQTMARKVAAYDVKDADFYQDDYSLYTINFYLPEGRVLAAYDPDGKLLRTAERFENINLPLTVKNAILGRFPNWTMTKNSYLVRYKDGRGSDKIYKIKLENGNEVIRVKLDENGEYIE